MPLMCGLITGESSLPKRSTLKIAKRTVDALRVDDGDATFWDRDLAGFGVRVHATGRHGVSP